MFLRLIVEQEGWLTVPSLDKMGPRAFWEHLEGALGSGVQVSPSGKVWLDWLTEGPVDMETVNGIVNAFSRSGDRVLMAEHIIPFRRSVRPKRKRSGGGNSGGVVAWTLGDFVNKGVVRKETAEYEYLRLGMEREDEQLTPDEIRSHMAAVNGRQLSDRAISSALSRLRRKLRERPCGWVLGRPNLILTRELGPAVWSEGE